MERSTNLLQSILDILYPRRCPICSKIVMNKGELACIPCSNKLSIILEPRCKKCSKAIENEEAVLCLDCTENQHSYEYGYALWLYDANMKKSIADFKYNGRKEYKDFYTKEIVKVLGEQIRKMDVDVLVPIPLHKAKERRRGFNQAELIANGIGQELNLPILKHLLIRNKNTMPQKQLDNVGRLQNLQKAFEFSYNEYKKYGKPIEKIVLVDDIYTTGSTIEACSKILKEQGISKIYFICLCIGKGY